MSKKIIEGNPNLGIFVHFGLYSIPAYDDMSSVKRRTTYNGAEWYKKRLEVKEDSYRPISGHAATKEYHKEHYGDQEYDDFAKVFKPKVENVDIWVKTAKEAGASYIILTSKHHDGYCLWPTKTGFGSKIDIVQVFKDATEKYGLIFGLYYSWSEFTTSFTKKYIEDKVKPQIEELIKYQPKILFFDGHWDIKSKFAKDFVLDTCKRIRKKIPSVIINDRLGEVYKNEEDLGHADYRNFSDRYIPPKRLSIAWEHCNTIGYSWGRNKQQKEEDYKSVEDLVKLYKQVRKLGGKFLLNLGPDGKGKLDPFEVERLLEFGKEIKKLDESKFNKGKSSKKKEESSSEEKEKKKSKKESKEESSSEEKEKKKSKKKKSKKKSKEESSEEPKKKSKKKNKEENSKKSKEETSSEEKEKKKSKKESKEENSSEEESSSSEEENGSDKDVEISSDKESNTKMGKVRVGQKRSRGVIGDHDASAKGYTNIDVTSGSMNKLNGIPCKSLSPMLLGPVTDKQGLTANIFECYWQFSKLYEVEGHIKKGTKCEPTKEFFAYRKKGFALTKGKRRPFPVKTHGYPTCAYYNNKSYNYLDSRKEIYVPIYRKLIEKLPIIKELRKLLKEGKNIMIIDGDGPPKKKYPEGLEMTQENWNKMIDNPKYPFGHGYVVASIISGLPYSDEAEESSKKEESTSSKETKKKSKKKSKEKKESTSSKETKKKSKKKSKENKKSTSSKETKKKLKEKEESSSDKEKSKKKSKKKDMSNLRIFSWNPAGIRALVKNNNEKKEAKGHLEAFVREQQPDIVFFPETKGNAKLEAEMEKVVNKVFKKARPDIKYTWYWSHSDKPGRFGNAVAVSERVGIEEVKYGFKKRDDEGRVIALKLKDTSLIKEKGVWVLGLYVPNASTELVRLDFKIEWMKKLRKFADKLREDNSVIIIGDINIAPEDTDIANPSSNKRTPGFTSEEKDYFKDFLGEEYIDAFRERNPAPNKSQGDKGDYTYWNQQNKSRDRNAGWRLDLSLVSIETYNKKGAIRDVSIYPQYWGSDHCPIGIEIKPIKNKKESS